MSNKEKSPLVPQRRFPEFQSADGWINNPLMEVCSKITQGGTPDTSKPEYWGGSINWMTPAEMGKTESPFINTTNRTITELGLSDCSSEVLPFKSVILSVRAPIGHLAINTAPMAINQGCKGLIAGASLDCYFLYFSLINSKGQLIDLGAGNTFKELSGSALKSFEIPIPSLPEQQKIADCLSSLDELIAAQARKVAALKTHKKGLIQQLFPCEGETQPRLRFPEFRDAGEWQETRLGQLGELVSGLTYSPDDVRESGLLVLRSSNVQNGKIALDDCVYVEPNIKGANLSSANDILICVRNGSTALIGKNALIPEGMPLCTHGAFMTVFRSKSPEFVFQLLQTDKYQKQVAGDLGATINSINGGQLVKYKFMVPKRAEQLKLAELLSSIDDLIATETQGLGGLKIHKRGLMQQLFPSAEAVEA